MSKAKLTEDTVIVIGKSIPLSRYRDFFEETTGKKIPGCELLPWLSLQSGKTLEKYSAAVFEFPNPTLEKLPDYIAVLNEFYSLRKID